MNGSGHVAYKSEHSTNQITHVTHKFAPNIDEIKHMTCRITYCRWIWAWRKHFRMQHEWNLTYNIKNSLLPMEWFYRWHSILYYCKIIAHNLWCNKDIGDENRFVITREWPTYWWFQTFILTTENMDKSITKTFTKLCAINTSSIVWERLLK